MPYNAPLKYASRLLTLLTLIFVLPLQFGCGPDKQQRALRASLVAVNSARDGFVAWDREHQQAMVARATSAEQARAALDAYRLKRAAATEAFEVAYKLIAIAAIDPTGDNVRAVARAVFEMLAKIEVLRVGPGAPQATPAAAPGARLLLPTPRRAPDPDVVTRAIAYEARALRSATAGAHVA